MISLCKCFSVFEVESKCFNAAFEVLFNISVVEEQGLKVMLALTMEFCMKIK